MQVRKYSKPPVKESVILKHVKLSVVRMMTAPLSSGIKKRCLVSIWSQIGHSENPSKVIQTHLQDVISDFRSVTTPCMQPKINARHDAKLQLKESDSDQVKTNTITMPIAWSNVNLRQSKRAAQDSLTVQTLVVIIHRTTANRHVCRNWTSNNLPHAKRIALTICQHISFQMRRKDQLSGRTVTKVVIQRLLAAIVTAGLEEVKWDSTLSKTNRSGYFHVSTSVA